jgi:hypothetical protein
LKSDCGSGHLVTLKEVYYVPASIGNLLSLLSLLQHGLTVDMCDDGGTIKRGNERLILHKDGPLWNTVLGTNPCTCLDIGSEGKSILEQEHQRLGHIGRSRLFDLAKAGKLRGSVGFTQRPANARSVSEPKSKGTPRMAKRRDCEVDASVDGHRYLFVGVERSSGIVFAVPIGSKAEAMRVVEGSSHQA